MKSGVKTNILARLLAISLLLSSCGAHVYKQHMVKEGETLYSISFNHGMDYRDVAAWNGIKTPYTINAGQSIRLTPAGTPHNKTPTKQPSPVYEQTDNTDTTIAVNSKPVISKPVKQPRPQANISRAATPTTQARTEPTATARPRWQWPAIGKVIKTFSNKEGGRKGLDIVATQGAPVRAAAAGRIVYSGNGIPRYGKLLIVKHDEEYLSAYAHNNALLVKEGDEVTTGQKIALMGSTGTDRTMLHFEIRKHGKPVNPLWYLPKR